MNSVLEQIIKYDSEGANLDFKKEEYSLGRVEKKYEILKDISAFANHHSDADKYILIGVKEVNGVADSFFEIENLTDEAKYQQFLVENIEPKINFEYKSVMYDGIKIAYFRIFDNKNRPYLFKKNLQNPITNNTEYKVGDGFIRLGASSRKLERADFESIYKNRFAEKDRKNDLVIESYFGTSDNEEIINFNVKYLDIRIENQSNKSIEFDVEMKVFQSENVTLISEDELVKKIIKNREKPVRGFGVDYEIMQPQMMNLNIHLEENDSFILISRNRFKKGVAINLAQNSFESDIFCKYLLVLGDVNEIKAELIIRSDAFTEGRLIKELIFKK